MQNAATHTATIQDRPSPAASIGPHPAYVPTPLHRHNFLFFNKYFISRILSLYAKISSKAPTGCGAIMSILLGCCIFRGHYEYLPEISHVLHEDLRLALSKMRFFAPNTRLIRALLAPHIYHFTPRPASQNPESTRPLF